MAPSFLQDAAKSQLELAERVVSRLHLREQTVEGRDVAAEGIGSEDVRLDQRRSRTDERVVDAVPRREVAGEEDLDELRDEFAQVRVKTVDVLRPLDLRQLVLRPRKLEIDLSVQRFLRPSRHG